MLVLEEVPPPIWSDGSPDLLPSTHKSSYTASSYRATPLSDFIECDRVRSQKFLDKLTPQLKEVYQRRPDQMQGVDPNAIRKEGGVLFKSGAVLRRFPYNYGLFEMKKKSGLETPVKVEGEEDKRIRNDAFVFGHPSGSKYRSTNEFILHLLWMINDDTHDHKNCTCKLCPAYCKSGGRPTSKQAKIALESLQVPSGTGKRSGVDTPNDAGSGSRFASPLPPAEMGRDGMGSVGRSNGSSSHGAAGSAAGSSHRAPPQTSYTHNDSDSDVPAPGHKSSKTGKRKHGEGKDKESKYKKKCQNLKRKMEEAEQENETLLKSFESSKRKIQRLKFETRLILDKMDKMTELGGKRANGEDATSPSASSDSDSASSSSPRHNPSPYTHHPNRPTAYAPPSYAPPPSQQPPIPVIVMPAKPPIKKKPKIVDPNAPRRPANAFMLFCEMERGQLKKERNEMGGFVEGESGMNLTKMLGARWRQLGDEGRRKYRDLFHQQVARYDREMVDYKRKVAAGLVVPSGTATQTSGVKVEEGARDEGEGRGDSDDDEDDDGGDEEVWSGDGGSAAGRVGMEVDG
ncbi:hypothetical protein HDV00_008116 [Rhizophlyctis rosea]|nr:hypothetical protein HDV00_008116 [Rhizophlyctis rosea]